jgi:hypothetical protein
VHWRALNAGVPASPSAAYSYIHRSLRQTMPFVMGALMLLADSYEPERLNEIGFSLYADFRPTKVGWGEKGQVSCEHILSLRKRRLGLAIKTKDDKNENGKYDKPTSDVAVTPSAAPNGRYDGGSKDAGSQSSPATKGMSLEEYEAILDDDPVWTDAAVVDI